jgi:hypothetical protein
MDMQAASVVEERNSYTYIKYKREWEVHDFSEGKRVGFMRKPIRGIIRACMCEYIISVHVCVRIMVK